MTITVATTVADIGVDAPGGGRLIDLLCLKNSRRGFCADLGIASRAASPATQ